MDEYTSIGEFELQDVPVVDLGTSLPLDGVSVSPATGESSVASWAGGKLNSLLDAFIGVETARAQTKLQIEQAQAGYLRNQQGGVYKVGSVPLNNQQKAQMNTGTLLIIGLLVFVVLQPKGA